MGPKTSNLSLILPGIYKSTPDRIPFEHFQMCRGPIVGHTAQNLDAQQVLLNTFQNIIIRRVDILEDIQRFQKTLQYIRSKVNYAIGNS